MCCSPSEIYWKTRTVLIETKQQQLVGIIRTYQALGGGYLVTTSGTEFAAILCQPADMVPVDTPSSSLPEDVEPGSTNGEVPPPREAEPSKPAPAPAKESSRRREGTMPVDFVEQR